MYHTCFPRTRQTAEGIAGGLKSIGARVSFEGELPDMNLPLEDGMNKAIWDHPEGSWFISDWLSHRLPSTLSPIRGNYRYLNGFILQFDEDVITAYSNEGARQVSYPCWWEPT